VIGTRKANRASDGTVYTTPSAASRPFSSRRRREAATASGRLISWAMTTLSTVRLACSRRASTSDSETGEDATWRVTQSHHSHPSLGAPRIMPGTLRSPGMIRLDGVSKVWPDGQVAVHELTLDVPTGAVAVLVGPSGCGKTTTMRMVNRLVEPTSGRIYLGDEDVTTVDPVLLRRRIGYVIQSVGLFPHLTVAANIATVPKLLGWDRRRIDARVAELLELVGMTDPRYAKRYPHELSGGQRQRVGVARALAADPPVLLMDEPFGAIDPVQRGRLQDEFLRLQQTVRKTVVFVTHDIEEAVKLGDRIAVMGEGGVLLQYATPGELLASPASEAVAAFVGADRAVKRLAVTRVPTVGLPARTAAGGPQVRSDATLHDALAALLADGRGFVAVVDPDGHELGILDPAAIAAALNQDEAAAGR
jgi:osmoprotectant transport system ATP-binding protein